MKVTEKVIEENLKRVEEGRELTIPLVVLNGEFKKRWFKDKEYNRVVRRLYYRNNKKRLREYQREYYQRPEAKEKRREYNQRPEVKEYQREYYQRPEVKEKRREYQREYYQRPEVKEYQREYNQRPEAKEYQREYYRRQRK